MCPPALPFGILIISINTDTMAKYFIGISPKNIKFTR
ncbi:MAG: hypothetical protein CM15mP107_1460 [Bacteroidota bacterium]|nr:MAG: hypothetical protein CM15mP107_1460 [Bacteroidota bacterium]